jgi:LCP family protein required for cell wall assembly
MPREQSRLAHPISSAAFSTLLPGLGQLIGGRRKRGLALMLPAVLVVAAVAALAARSRADLFGLLVQPAFLWTLVAVDFGILAWRLYAVIDAYQLARMAQAPATPAGVGVAVGISFLLLVTTVPHALAASYGLQTVDVLSTVFRDNPEPTVALVPEPPRHPSVPPAVLPTGTTAPPDTTPTASGPAAPTTTLPGSFTGGLLPPLTVPDPTLEAPPHGQPLEEQVRRITILLAGADAGPGRRGFRTDSIMVASFDTVNKKAVLFGIPRNLSWVPLPKWMEDRFDEECKCFPEPINHLYGRTKTWTGTFREEVDPGMAALREVLEEILGVYIDYYVLVDMKGFVRLVDALGGVTVYVTAPLHDRVSPVEEDAEWIEIEVDPGRQHLNGHEALAYVRSRSGSSDYNRMSRQRCVLSALAAGADPLKVLARFDRIADAVKRSVTTDIRLALLPELARLAAELEADDIATVGFVPNYYSSEWIEGAWAPDVAKIQRTVRLMLRGDYSAPLVNSGGKSECGR